MVLLQALLLLLSAIFGSKLKNQGLPELLSVCWTLALCMKAMMQMLKFFD